MTLPFELILLIAQYMQDITVLADLYHEQSLSTLLWQSKYRYDYPQPFARVQELSSLPYTYQQLYDVTGWLSEWRKEACKWQRWEIARIKEMIPQQEFKRNSSSFLSAYYYPLFPIAVDQLLQTCKPHVYVYAFHSYAYQARVRELSPKSSLPSPLLSLIQERNLFLEVERRVSEETRELIAYLSMDYFFGYLDIVERMGYIPVHRVYGAASKRYPEWFH